MEKLMNNHNVNLEYPGNYFLDELTLRSPSSLNIPCWGFLASSIAYLSPLLTQHGYYDKNASQSFTINIGGIL